MRIEEIPQDPSILEGHLRACYARDASGRYVVATSRGWEVERIANELAVAQVNSHIELARAAVRAGKASALAYHMACAHMTPSLLAAQSGFWVWQVKRHLKPQVFQRLSLKALRRYASALGIGMETLASPIPE
ncbi:MAG: hypothetical protein ACKVQA_18445 [Burkholderiales bacterium]